MPEKTFGWFPVTEERPAQNLLFILNAAHYDPDRRVVTVDDDYQGNLNDVVDIIALNDTEFRFTNDNDELVILRPTRPDDAARWDRTVNRIPLPVEIIGAIMAQTIPEPTVAAAVDEQGDVHTMILETGVGLYARYSASWIRMTDISPIEQLDIISVPASDLDIYDLADQRGDSVNIRFLHPIDQPAPSAISVTPAPTVTVASAAMLPIVITSAADLPDAITWAATDEGVDARWYVSRRAHALGWADPLPWEQSEP